MSRTAMTPKRDLRAENAKLRADLHELQETLRAIREDAVDAFVIETSHGPKIFMLQEPAAESSMLRDKILATITDAVVVYGDDDRVLYLNAAAADRYGVSTSDALGGLIDGIFRVRWPHPEAEVRKTAALRDNGTWQGESVHVTRTGKVMLVEVTVTRLDRDGGQPPIWLVATHAAAGASGAGAQTTLDTQARELRRWEVIGALAAHVADDASAIDDSSEAVDVQPSHRDAVTQRARELRQQLHAMDRSRTSLRPLVSVATIVDEVARLLRIGLPKEIAVESGCAANTPRIRADAIQLMQALLNLGGNAAHAIEGQPGTIDIQAAEVTVTEAMALEEPRLRSGHFVRIAVSDTGHGMDAETQQRAFEPYFSRKLPGLGVGLGLTRVQGIVHEHQGVIVLHSAPGRGSTFELYLPCVS